MLHIWSQLGSVKQTESSWMVILSCTTYCSGLQLWCRGAMLLQCWARHQWVESCLCLSNFDCAVITRDRSTLIINAIIIVPWRIICTCIQTCIVVDINNLYSKPLHHILFWRSQIHNLVALWQRVCNNNIHATLWEQPSSSMALAVANLRPLSTKTSTIHISLLVVLHNSMGLHWWRTLLSRQCGFEQ